MTENLALLVDEDLSALACRVCPDKAVVLSRAGAHIKAACGRGHYIKFCRQKLMPDERRKWDGMAAARKEADKRLLQ